MTKSIIYLILKNLRENVLFRANKAERKSLIKTFFWEISFCAPIEACNSDSCVSVLPPPPPPLINDEWCMVYLNFFILGTFPHTLL